MAMDAVAGGKRLGWRPDWIDEIRCRNLDDYGDLRSRTSCAVRSSYRGA